MRKEIEVFVEKLREDIELPFYVNEGDSGMDVRASEDVVILPQNSVIVKTGLKFAIPNGYEIQVRPRSGISFKTPLRVSNSPGTIDSPYKDELGIIITNTSINLSEKNGTFTINDKGNKHGIYQIKKGDRIAQLVLQEVPKMKLTITDDVKKYGTDRQGGFGSTGTK